MNLPYLRSDCPDIVGGLHLTWEDKVTVRLALRALALSYFKDRKHPILRAHARAAVRLYRQLGSRVRLRGSNEQA